jgi:DNA-binding transcriptional ArsR family regulator
MKRGLTDTCYRFFATLANPARLAILEVLIEGPRSVNDIAQKLKQEQSMISHNLKTLESCGFVFRKRRKKQQIYSLNSETMAPLFKLFKFHFEKYCSTDGRCGSEKDLKKRRTQEASRILHVTHE